MLQEFWILSHSGDELYHFTSLSNTDEKKTLLNNFLSSLHQIASDMGDSMSYHVENDNCLIVGKAISNPGEDLAYLIGKFQKERRTSLKKCVSMLNSLMREFREYDMTKSTEIAKCKEKLNNFLKKVKY